jgi:hypothetical protein
VASELRSSDWLSGLAAVLDLMEGRMRRFVVLAIAILVVLIGYAIKTTESTSPTAASLMAVATPVATLSPHEIHLNYKGMKDLRTPTRAVIKSARKGRPLYFRRFDFFRLVTETTAKNP